ncbi:MAG: hypothetical protein AB7L84_09175 [Acidimicrobiia bacterium]
MRGEAPIVREQVYDDAGRVVTSRVQGDAGWNCTTYDDRDRTTEVIYAGGTNQNVDATCG